MKRTALSAAIFVFLAAPALSQEASNPMVLVVRPSGVDSADSEAKERQEKLLRRLEQSNHMIRSICRNCGDEWKHQIYEPFHPLATLGTRGAISEERAN